MRGPRVGLSLTQSRSTLSHHLYLLLRLCTMQFILTTLISCVRGIGADCLCFLQGCA
jgi:hypothetical protein